MRLRTLVLALALALMATTRVAGQSDDQSPGTEAAPRWRDVTVAEVTLVYPAACVDGVCRQPDGPFAVIALCDGSLGTHVALTLLRMGDPVLGKWSLWDRFWQEDRWSSDVTAIAWEPGGSRLFISTGSVYGSATVWVIDPLDRTARSLLDQEAPDICGVTLRMIDAKEHLVVARLSDCTREGSDVALRF